MPALRRLAVRFFSFSLSDLSNLFAARELKVLELQASGLLESRMGVVRCGAEVQPTELSIMDCGAPMALTMLLSLGLAAAEPLIARWPLSDPAQIGFEAVNAYNLDYSGALAAVTDMEGITMPIGLFDPLGFSKGASEEALMWYREAELKHGRVAMAAFVGFLVNYQGVTFPASLTMSGEKFSSLGTGAPLAAWDNLSDKGKWSILGFIGLLEVLGEAEKPHYMRGGKSGTNDLVWYFGSKYISGKSDEAKLRSRTAEINNGRLAMVGIMSLISASTVQGSVPYFEGVSLEQYTGSVWAPF